MKTRRFLVSVPSMETTKFVSRGFLTLLVALSVLGLSTAAMGAEDRNLGVEDAAVKPGKPRAGDLSFNPADTHAVDRNPERCPAKEEGGEAGFPSSHLPGQGVCHYTKPKSGDCKDLGSDCDDVGPDCSCDPADKPKGDGGLQDPGQMQTPGN